MQLYPSGTFVFYDRKKVSNVHSVYADFLTTNIYVILHNHEPRHRFGPRLKMMPVFSNMSSKDSSLFRLYHSEERQQLLDVLSIRDDEEFLDALKSLPGVRLTVDHQDKLFPLSTLPQHPRQLKDFRETYSFFSSELHPLLLEMQSLFLSRYNNHPFSSTGPSLIL